MGGSPFGELPIALCRVSHFPPAVSVTVRGANDE